MDLGLTGRACLVTGSTAGIGLETARQLIAEGAHVVTCGRRDAPGLGERHHVAADLSLAGEPERAVVEAAAALGGLDVLVNNVGIARQARFEEVTDAEWRAMMSRLLDEPFYCLRAALRVMRPARRGKIINMSSAAAFPGLANYAAYTAARAGVNGLTKAVGREVARDGIQVNAIAQNYVENPTYFPPSLTADPQKLARMVRNIPAGRLARSEESARLAVYLASEDADFFVGQVIPFSGGWVTG